MLTCMVEVLLTLFIMSYIAQLVGHHQVSLFIHSPNQERYTDQDSTIPSWPTDVLTYGMCTRNFDHVALVNDIEEINRTVIKKIIQLVLTFDLLGEYGSN